MKYLPYAVNVNDYFDDNTVENKHLPVDRIGVLVADDDYVEEMITYLIVTNHTKGDWTINDVDRFYDLIICNNSINYYYGIMIKDESINSYYIDNSKISLIKNEMRYDNVRLLFDDGG